MRLSMPSASIAGPTVDPAAAAFFVAAAAAGGPVSAPRQTIYNNLFTNLRSSGWLARLDRLGLPAAESQAQGLVDLITLQTYSITGTMTFAANLGLTSNGTTGFIDTGLAPSAATKFTLNKAMYGVAITSTRSTGAVMCVMGTSSDNVGECRIYPSYTGAQSFTSINGQFTTSTPTPPTVHGMYFENRPDSGHMVYYQNTTVLRNDAKAAMGLDTGTFLVSATHTAGVAADFSTDTNGGFWIGDGATGDADQAVLEGILQTYFTAIGAL